LPRRLVFVTRGLRVIGVALVLIGAAAITISFADPERIRTLLPPLAIDASAVGGALAALGAGCVTLGVAHLAVAFGLRRRTPWAHPCAIVFSATLGMLWLAVAAASLVSAGRGVGYVLAAIGLTVLALAYGLSAAVVIGQMRSMDARIGPDRSTEGRPQA
jgi:hypothetical protein